MGVKVGRGEKGETVNLASQPTGQSNEKENLSFYLSVSNPFVLWG